MTHSCIQVAKVEDIPDGWMGLDNGPESTKMIQVCCSVLQRVYVCCSVLRCSVSMGLDNSTESTKMVQVCCSVLR